MCTDDYVFNRIAPWWVEGELSALGCDIWPDNNATYDPLKYTVGR